MGKLMARRKRERDGKTLMDFDMTKCDEIL